MSTPPPDSLEALYADLARHDWFYMMSDDGRVYDAGRWAEKKLQSRAAALGKQGDLLFAEYQAHVFSGEPFGKERKPQPQLKDYL